MKTLGIFAISLIFLLVIFTLVLFVPTFSVGVLLLIRASLGPLRDVAWYPLGLKVNILSLFGGFVIVLGVIYWAFKGARSKHLFLVFYFLFLIWCSISLIYSKNIKIGLYELLKFCAPMMFFFIIENEMKGWNKALLTLRLIALSSLLPIAYGFYQFFSGTGGSTRAGFQRISSFFVLPNPFAFYLVLVTIVSLLLNLLSQGMKARIAYSCLFTLSLTCLIWTATRTAFLGLVVGLFVFCGLNKKWGMIMAFILLTVVILVSFPKMRQRLEEPFKRLVMGEKNPIKKRFDINKPLWEMDTFENRLRIWKSAVEHFRERPIRGFGVGSAKAVIGIECHNDYLRLLLETGIIGFLLYIGFLVTLLTNRIKAWWYIGDTKRKLVLCAVISLQLSFMTIMLADNIVNADTYLWYLFAVFAITFNVEKQGELEKAL